MKRVLVSILAMVLYTNFTYAQTASEIPLTNPEVLEPPSREQGISPKPEDGNSAKTSTSSPMTFAKLAEIVIALDEDAKITPGGIQFSIFDVPVILVVDPNANRMRAFSAFKTLDGVDGQILYRMMQANFDSALDARYAIAKGHLISVFIHPLGELDKRQFIEGIGQVVNLVKTYGTAFTSGAITFGGGDSNKLHRKLIDELLKKGDAI